MKIKLIDPLNNEKIFDSKSAAAKFLGVNESSVRKAIKKNRVCKGYKCYLVEPVLEEIGNVTLTLDNNSKYLDSFKWILTPTENLPKVHLVIPDVHIPYGNVVVLHKIVNMMRDNKFDGLHILGDFLDMTSLSSHDFMKVNNGVTLSEEYEIGNNWLDILTQHLPKTHFKSYIAGNHELRYQKYMRGAEASKLGDALLSPTKALRLRERGFYVVEDYPDGYVKIGNVQVIHGIFLNSNHGKSHLQRLHSSCMYGHSHQQITYSENGWTAYNIGHLANPSAPIFSYSNRFEKANWNQGFGVITVVDDNTTLVQNIEVRNGSFIYNGKIY